MNTYSKNNYLRIGVVALLPLILGGCDLIQSKEDQCLQSARLTFKDPDSLKVVQNLGDRGELAYKASNMFWLRYSATNTYGGRVSANMACMKEAKIVESKVVEGEWARSEKVEEYVRSKLLGSFYRTDREAQIVENGAALARHKACKTDACRTDAVKSFPTVNSHSERQAASRKKAEEIIYEETGALYKLAPV